jgi:hypothetical protein
MGPGEKVSALQDPDETPVHHALHYLTQATSEAELSVSSCLRAISATLQNRDDGSFFPGVRQQALHPQAVVRG